jgi:hypothetical protein
MKKEIGRIQKLEGEGKFLGHTPNFSTNHIRGEDI